MITMRKRSAALLALLLAVSLALAACTASDGSTEEEQEEATSEVTSEQEAVFRAVGLATDVSTHSIELDQVLGGGPPKDGIPALTDPAFVSVDEAGLAPEQTGILLDLEGEQRFYPFNILVWHEIVNDTIGSTDVAVTF
jgi:hypothetical protein